MRQPKRALPYGAQRSPSRSLIGGLLLQISVASVITGAITGSFRSPLGVALAAPSPSSSPQKKAPPKKSPETAKTPTRAQREPTREPTREGNASPRPVLRRALSASKREQEARLQRWGSEFGEKRTLLLMLDAQLKLLTRDLDAQLGEGLTPTAIAASTNSLFLIDRVWPRTIRAMPSQDTMPIPTKINSIDRP